MKYEIKDRFTGNVQFTAEIDCDKHELPDIKIGLAVKWALKNGANLRGADLRGADLRGAYLGDADLRDADLRRADLRDAYMRGADLSGANLRGANLSGAYLRDASVVDGGQRSDGFRFIGTTVGGTLMIAAGCRWFTITEAREYWQETRAETPLGDETFAILDHIEAVAKIRNLVQ